MFVTAEGSASKPDQTETVRRGEFLGRKVAWETRRHSRGEGKKWAE